MNIASKAWHAAKGAERFVSAILSGDIATDEERERRLSICRECPKRVRIRVMGADSPSDWCGVPFLDVPGSSCGCLLAGKASVQSEQCPRGLWGVTSETNTPRPGAV